MRPSLFLLALLLALATACAAPPDGASDGASASAPAPASPDAPAAVPDPDGGPDGGPGGDPDGGLDGDSVGDPGGDPGADDAAPAPTADAPGEVDYSCSVDADCTVKNVGNCCGYYPACVNVDSPVFPDQVKAACEREGRSSICGFPAISGCRCVDGRCEAQSGPGAAALE